MMPPIYLHYLNAPDVEALALTDDEIIAAVEAGLAAQGRRETVIERRADFSGVLEDKRHLHSELQK